ncbi:MAG: glycerol-3-phosphate 1-O-acyltransferase PlsY [Acidobacteriota bacterium]|nr:glycerol-3-phosphate 1-O-acyltransferase PlsY [Acidobacteriota bacterium]MDW3228592.1 glycerol-3-phosphate 1-O-acyltransferase PlsY [Acidobacteriota bacterium]
MKILFLIGSYLLGAFPTGFLLVKLTSKRDIREVGSGSTGATNVLRYGGWKLAIPVLLIDGLKGFLPAILATALFDDQKMTALAVLAAVIGHCYPVYLKFRGGKGVATSLGGYLYLAPRSLIISLGLALILLLLFRYVSLASLAGLLSFPFWTLLTFENNLLFWTGLLIFLVIFIRHRQNINRLIAGTERKLGDRVHG